MALQDLYLFESALDAAFDTWLTDNLGLSGVQILQARERDTIQTPSIALRTEHRGAFDGLDTQYKTHNGIHKEAAFRGQLNTTIMVHRSAHAGNRSGEKIAAYLRAALYDCGKASGLNDSLTNHHLYSIIETGTGYEEMDEEQLDVIAITWDLIYTIKDTVWP